jgi:uncharacterized damage-inducible protein DinB
MEIKKVSLEPVSGFSEQIGFHIAGMAEVREQLSDAVEDLSNEEIAAKVLPDVHSIGQLILHNAEAEWWWIKCVASGKELNEEEAIREAHWDILLEKDFALKDYSAKFCIDEVNRVRRMCLDTVRTFTDKDLDKFYGWDKKDGTRTEVTLRWILHHLIDHEAQHKGQILMLKRLLRDK